MVLSQRTWNEGGYSNPAIDQLIKNIQVELDNEKRNEFISKALSIVKEDFAYLPLHQQIVFWAARDNVDQHNRAPTTCSCAM